MIDPAAAEMERVEEFRRTGRAYVDPTDDKKMDYATRPAPRKNKKQKKGKK
jgi:hypothetical protein